MNRTNMMRGLLGACLVATAACRGAAPPVGVPATPPAQQPDAGPAEAPHQEGEHEEHEEHEELPTHVQLTGEAEKQAHLRLEPVVRAPLAATMDLTGEVVADPDQVARVAARAAGRVVEVRFREGDTVKRDAVMVVLESADLARARAAWTTSDARARNARVQADRLAGVARDGLVTALVAQTAEAEAVALEADAVAARQGLGVFGVGTEPVEPERAGRLEVKAPMGGVVVARSAVVGESVPVGQVLGTVVNLQKAYFHARLFERNLAHVQAGQPAEVTLNAHPDQPLPGVVESVGHQVDPVARTVVARIAVRNRDGMLRLGLFGTARLAMDTAGDAPRVLTLPTSAVTRLGRQDVAFVALPDGRFEVHPLTLGARAAGRVEVIRGLGEGEKVVTEGVFSLKSLVLKSTFGEED